MQILSYISREDKVKSINLKGVAKGQKSQSYLAVQLFLKSHFEY